MDKAQAQRSIWPEEQQPALTTPPTIAQVIEILESISDTLCIVDAEWRVTYISHKGMEIWGAHYADLVGKISWEVFPQTIGTSMSLELQRAMHEQQLATFEYHAVASKRWFAVRAYPNGPGLIICFIDITEHKQAQEALHQSKKRFQSYFELGLIGMALTSLTKGLVEINHHLCTILGYEREELLHMTWAELTYPDDLDADIANFTRVLAGEIEGYSMDKRFIHKDGQLIDTTVSVKCLRRSDNSVDYFVALVQDVTVRRQTDQALRLSEDKLRLAIQSAGFGTWDFYPQTGKFYWSDECKAIFGVAPTTEPTLEMFLSIIHPDDRERVEATMKWLFTPTSQEISDSEYRIIGYADGQTRWINAQVQAYFDEQGNYVQLSGIVRNITAQKQTDIGLRQTNQELEAKLAAATRQLVETQAMLQAALAERKVVEGA